MEGCGAEDRIVGLLASIRLVVCVCAYKHRVSAVDVAPDREVAAGWVSDDSLGVRDRSLEVSSE